MTRPPPEPGDFFLSRISGTTGFAVTLGQTLIGDASRYTHAGIVMPDDRILAAQPGGARFDPRSALQGPVVYSTGKIPLTPVQRSQIVGCASMLVGTPYSFLDYLYLSAHRFGADWKWLEEEISTSRHMICSQLVDYVYCLSGVHIFTDGRIPQDVTPGDLANVLIEEW